MILFIFTVIFILFLVYLTLWSIKEGLSYYNLRFYEDQGLKTVYNPIFGYLALHDLDPASKEEVKPLKELFDASMDSSPALVFNQFDSVRPAILISDPQLLKDFYLKELQCSKKISMLDQMTLGFISKSGPSVMAQRTCLKAFFAKENMEHISPLIYSVFRKHFQDLISKNWDMESLKKSCSEPDWKCIKFDDFGPQIFTDIVDLILNGEDKPVYTLDGKHRLVTKMNEFSATGFAAVKQPLCLLSCKVLTNMNIDPYIWEVTRLRKSLEEACLQIIAKRRTEGKKESVNLVDMLIEFQDSLPEGEKVSNADLAWNIILLNLAGSDTSSSVSKSIFYETSVHKHIHERLTSAVDPFNLQDCNTVEETDKVVQELMVDKDFDSCIKELLRMNSPLAYLPTRMLTKNIKLGKYKFKKGDIIITTNGMRNESHELNDSPDEFRPERFTDKTTSDSMRTKVAYNPFNLGSRNCIGQYLAYVYLKCFTACLVSMLELKEDTTVTK